MDDFGDGLTLAYLAACAAVTLMVKIQPPLPHVSRTDPVF